MSKQTEMQSCYQPLKLVSSYKKLHGTETDFKTENSFQIFDSLSINVFDIFF